ncbi:MAG TPA: hypothetical protein VG938_07470, partial [Verrucomicrobiae bacterium]|nr:hypothetical protein [Verrucomicrobiae bacterium]
HDIGDEFFLSTLPKCSTGGFCGCRRDGFNGRVAEGEQDLFCFLLFSAAEFFERFAKCFHAEIFLTGGALDAVDEGRQIDQFAARVHEIKVKHLLLCHNSVCLRQYNAFCDCHNR